MKTQEITTKKANNEMFELLDKVYMVRGDLSYCSETNGYWKDKERGFLRDHEAEDDVISKNDPCMSRIYNDYNIESTNINDIRLQLVKIKKDSIKKLKNLKRQFPSEGPNYQEITAVCIRNNGFLSYLIVRNNYLEEKYEKLTIS